MCVVGVCIHNIYYIYIYERFSDFRYGFGAGEFITEPNEAHTESVVGSPGHSVLFLTFTYVECLSCSVLTVVSNPELTNQSQRYFICRQST